jgi:peroxiredoxin
VWGDHFHKIRVLIIEHGDSPKCSLEDKKMKVWMFTAIGLAIGVSIACASMKSEGQEMGTEMAAKEAMKAPEFTTGAADGTTVSLADYKGKYVVLEWWNYQCPFVVKHYQGNMQKLQEMYKDLGVVWLTICSSAEGKQGYVTSNQALEIMKKAGGNPTKILLDPSGKVGKLYKAKTTPHMFLISPEGVILYEGAIDSITSTNAADVDKAENYLNRAWEEAVKGKPVSKPKTAPYGCSVKYAD